MALRQPLASSSSISPCTFPLVLPELKDVLTLHNSGIGLQIPPWLYGVEITPLKLRYIAGAVTAASGKSFWPTLH
jgi:hypothetical protein